jgi:hypothetical protein
VQRITLKKYIEFIGTEPAAELFDCSTASQKLGDMVLDNPLLNKLKRLLKHLAAS